MGLLFALLWIWSCRDATVTTTAKPVPAQESASSIVQHHFDYDTSQWKELTTSMGFSLDLRYATANNFVKEVIYPCGRCFLMPKAADALRKINTQLKAQGLAIKLFDCYRPTPAQQKLWDKVPDRNYVAPPWKGSMHSRGVAVDLTLVSLDGKELDMGTAYDFFGPEAHHDYTNHAAAIVKNRTLLKTAMEAAGFQGIRTEWWHYSLKSVMPPLSDWQWPCK